MAIPALIPVLAPLLGKVVGNLFPDPEKAAEAQAKLTAELLAHDQQIQEAVAGIITAEAKSEHWLTATWRPITMLTFVAIIANNHILYPYLSLFFANAPVLEIPTDMWDLLKIGLGGYVVGRSAEKVLPDITKAIAAAKDR